MRPIPYSKQQEALTRKMAVTPTEEDLLLATRHPFDPATVGEITESVKRLAQSGSRASGLLFNGVAPSGHSYAYGGKYGRYRYVAYRNDRARAEK